jgi:hypothetical protein
VNAFARAAAALLVAIGTAGCATAALTPSASVTTIMQGWERYFRIEWEAQAKGDGVQIDGYLYNTYGSSAGGVRLLAQARDASDNVVAQTIEWVPGIVPNFGRSYFLIRKLPPAHHYSVTVWAFDIIDTDGFRRRWF